MKLIHTKNSDNHPIFFVVSNNGGVILSTGRGSFNMTLIEKLAPGLEGFGTRLKTPKTEFLVTPETPLINGIPLIISEEFQVENDKWENPLYSLPSYRATDQRETARSFLSQFVDGFIIGGVTYPDSSACVAFITSGYGVIPKPFSPLFSFSGGKFQFKYWGGSGLIIVSREQDGETIFRAYEQAL